MNTQNDIDKINKDLYEAGKIIWDSMNGAWTSKLWQDLSKQGARSSLLKAGFVSAYAPDGAKMGEWNGRVNMLVGIAKLLR